MVNDRLKNRLSGEHQKTCDYRHSTLSETLIEDGRECHRDSVRPAHSHPLSPSRKTLGASTSGGAIRRLDSGIKPQYRSRLAVAERNR
jgi:hypothetical protein